MRVVYIQEENVQALTDIGKIVEVSCFSPWYFSILEIVLVLLRNASVATKYIE